MRSLDASPASVIALPAARATGREADCLPLGGLRQRPWNRLEREPGPEPQAGQAGPPQPVEIGALLGGSLTDSHARGEEDLAALEPRSRVLELAHVDPPDGITYSGRSGHQPYVQARRPEEITHGERHQRIVRFVQECRALGVRNGATSRLNVSSSRPRAPQ